MRARSVSSFSGRPEQEGRLDSDACWAATVRGDSQPEGLGGPVFLRGCDADERLRELAEVRSAARPVLGALAARLVGARVYEQLGYRCLGDFAREHLGVGPRTVREWARVHSGLQRLPILRAALWSGELNFAAARLVVGVATPETDAACLECVRGRTVRAVRAIVAAFKQEKEREPAPECVWVRVRCTAEQSALWRAAVELARRMEGEEVPLWRCAEAVAAEAASAFGAPSLAMRESRAPSQSAACEAPPESGLRKAAYPHLGWDSAPRPGVLSALISLLEGLDDCPARAVGDRMQTAIRQLQGVDLETGRVLIQMGERRLFSALGFASLARYVDERLDLSARTARRLMALARSESSLPPVANAFRDGRLHAFQAEAIARVADHAGAEQWVERAHQVTFRRLADELDEAASRRPGVIAFRAPPEVARLFLGMLGRSGSLSRLLGHAIVTWVEQGRRFHDYADFERDGFRCVVPGCSARRNLHSHHIRFRSAGGLDVPWNRVTLCASHHERSLHRDGTLRIRGLAPDALVFELGEDRGERFLSGERVALVGERA